MRETNTSTTAPAIPGHEANTLLMAIADWGPVTTIVFSHGSVFEYKGSFPTGTLAEGYYNLSAGKEGLHGHLRLDAIDHIAFQTKPHRGQASYALVFTTAAGECMFKIFLGRDGDGEIFPHQLAMFNQLLDQYS